MRIWVCTENEKYSHPVWGRLRFAVSPYALIDLMAILPFYLIPVALAFDARFIRVLRLLRIFRIVKMARYSRSMSLLTRVLWNQKEIILITLTLLIMLIILASSLMWHVEHEIQPDKFTSIPETMWWAVATVTTVGYGDVYPITPIGKFLAATIAVLGIGVFGMPAGIIAYGFMEEIYRKKSNMKHHPEGSAERIIELLERFASLKESGTITEEEFIQQKSILLDNNNPPPDLKDDEALVHKRT